MRFRLMWLVLLMLIMGACSLTTEDDAEQDATPIPTANIGNSTPLPPAGRATNTPQPSATPNPTTAPTTQACTIRADWVATVTVQAGDTLFSIAQRYNTNADTLAQGNCLSNANAIQVGQTLRVPLVGATNTPSNNTGNTGNISTIPTNCANSWFFTFNSDVTESKCPNIITVSNAAGQNFQGGRVYWYEAAGVFSEDYIYVIYNDRTWTRYTDTWTPDQPFDDPSITPPQGFFAPVAGIGKIWREQPGVRDKLGWAYENESPFTGRRQEPIFPSPLQYYELYIDHGWRDLVLRLRTNLVGANTSTWIVAGGY